MSTIQHLFDEYSESHQNKTNKIIHWICIPLIFWSIISLLSLIPHDFMDVFKNDFLNDIMSWSIIVIFLGLIFYIRLSFNIFLGMLVFSSIVVLDIYYTMYLFKLNKFWGLFDSCNIDGNTFLLYTSIIIFICAWILQFLGHKIEGKKPSFLKDIQFLLIGPAWLLAFIYNRFKIRY